MYGIPNMKLDKSVIKRRRRLMEEEGVVFHTSVNIGKDMTSEELISKFDAVILCCGAKKPRGIPAADPAKVRGVMYAVDFLTETTKALMASSGRSVTDLKKQKGYTDAAGKNVIIIGGGDTGNDCIGTVIRHGAKSVTAIEMMPKPPVERTENNPWPEWPKTYKSDYGHEEASYVFGSDPRVFETTVKSIKTDKKGCIKEAETVRVSFENGSLKEVPGTEKTLKCDLLLIAAGFTGCEDYTAESFKLQRSNRGTVVTGAGSFRVGDTPVFSAGDMRRGQSLVVWAITEGRRCAKEADCFLMGYSNM